MEIIDYPKYLIYNDGKVQNKKTKRYLKPGTSGNGYLIVVLSNDGKKKNHTIHRLVGLHYIPNPENKRCIDHKNSIRTDNRVENLRWATDSENNQNTIVQKDNKLGIKNISYDKYHNIYVYEKIIKGVKHRKRFKTLKEAEEYKKLYDISSLRTTSQKII